MNKKIQRSLRGVNAFSFDIVHPLQVEWEEIGSILNRRNPLIAVYTKEQTALVYFLVDAHFLEKVYGSKEARAYHEELEAIASVFRQEPSEWFTVYQVTPESVPHFIRLVRKIRKSKWDAPHKDTIICSCIEV